MDESTFSFTWFSFILGFIAALIVMWALGRIAAWLKGAVQPPGDKPFRQKIAFGLRRLTTGLLLLLVLAVVAYMAYTILFR